MCLSVSRKYSNYDCSDVRVDDDDADSCNSSEFDDGDYSDYEDFEDFLANEIFDKYSPYYHFHDFLDKDSDYDVCKFIQLML